MKKRTSSCGICHNTNRSSICADCVNYRLNELKSLKSKQDSLYSKLGELLLAKGIVDDQQNYRLLQYEKVANLREKLHRNREQILQGKTKIERMSHDLNLRYGLLESAQSMLQRSRVEQLEKYYPNIICTQSLAHMAITSQRLHKQSIIVKQICKLFPLRRVTIEGEKKDGSGGQFDQICYARLPRAFDPHSVPSEELAASLGYMVQLLNLVVRNLATPALHNSGFAGSCSRIWQRNSYWDARPSSRSNEYPLFIPRQNYCSSSGENSWTERSYTNFGMESDRRPELDSSASSSFSYTSASTHSLETHRELQKGIALLKKSVASITAYFYNLLCLEVPTEMSTFEAFAKLLSTLSSTKEVRSAFSLKMASSRSLKQVQQLDKSVWNSTMVSSSLLESAHTLPMRRNISNDNFPSSPASFLSEFSNSRKYESRIDGWDLVERPNFPPPPSQIEDVEHWTRAMFVDATKK